MKEWRAKNKEKKAADHIVALDNFDLTEREQFLVACHYTNLQPLWESENCSKGSRK